MPAQNIRVIDSHTGGEPTRIIVDGGPDLGSGPLAERLAIFRDRFDDVRSAVINEPRGSDVLVGGLLCKADGSDLCGGHHLLQQHRLPSHVRARDDRSDRDARVDEAARPGSHRIETPVGIVTATLLDDCRASVRNVPSWRYRKAVPWMCPVMESSMVTSPGEAIGSFWSAIMVRI